MAKLIFFVVDDDPAYSRIVQAHLQAKYAAKVHVFHSGEECMQQLSLKPEIIILDYYLGEANRLNGKEVWKSLKDSQVKSKVIMMSAQGEGKIVLELVKMGVRDYVMKDEEAMTNLDDIIGEYFSAQP